MFLITGKICLTAQCTKLKNFTFRVYTISFPNYDFVFSLSWHTETSFLLENGSPYISRSSKLLLFRGGINFEIGCWLLHCVLWISTQCFENQLHRFWYGSETQVYLSNFYGIYVIDLPQEGEESLKTLWIISSGVQYNSTGDFQKKVRVKMYLWFKRNHKKERKALQIS